MKRSVKPDRIVARINTQVFHMTVRKQTLQGVRFMDERRPNSQEHEDCSGWQRHKIRLL